MLPTEPIIYLTPLTLVTLIASFFQMRANDKDLQKKKQEIDQKIYETEIYSEISRKIGYELNLEKIFETIITFLNKIMPYSVVSFLVIPPELNHGKIRFHLLEKVNRYFLDDIRQHMFTCLNKTFGTQLATENFTEEITGTIVDENDKGKVSSLWAVPVSIDHQGLGVLVVAYKKAGYYRGPEMEVINKVLNQAKLAILNLKMVLASEEEKLTSMISSMTDGVLMLDSQMNLVTINPAAIKILGLQFSPKFTTFDITSKLSDRLDLRSKVEESLREEKIVMVENLAINNRIFELLITAVKNAQQRHLGALILFHDVSAQKELDRVRDEFTAMMVHELRAPLTVVKGATDMFVRNPSMATTPEGTELIKTLRTSATTMLTLVSDLLDAAKIDAGKFQIIKTKGNLVELIKDRVVFFTQMAIPKSITIVNNCPDSEIQVDFDHERIDQVLNNLLSNAIKYTSVGGKVMVFAYKVNSPTNINWTYFDNKPDVSQLKFPAVIVSIADNGRGLSPEGINNLFSKFKQLQPSNGESKGTGLGLVIAKGIIESHGGEIFVQSKVNEGTTFYFTLPV